jgi:hypothetical protein
MRSSMIYVIISAIAFTVSVFSLIVTLIRAGIITP